MRGRYWGADPTSSLALRPPIEVVVIIVCNYKSNYNRLFKQSRVLLVSVVIPIK